MNYLINIKDKVNIMNDLTDIYNDIIMEHSLASYNKRKLENPGEQLSPSGHR